LNLATEASITTKVERMRGRVRWGHPEVVRRGIDQRRLAIDGAPGDGESFTFLVLGDSGTGRHRGSSPQRQVAKRLLAQGEATRFVLHTGDVVYLVGSSEQYRQNFIKPYREWLVNGDDYRAIAYDRMTFTLPFLPVPGNHDYYDLPLPLGVLAGISSPLRLLLRNVIDLDVGWHGSDVGDAYARAFLDVLADRPAAALGEHLDCHYTATVDGVRCLRQQPGSFTRLPNPYYHVRIGGIDIFALDSNTFNQPLPLELSPAGEERRERLGALREELAGRRRQLLDRIGAAVLDRNANPEAREDLTETLEQIDEQLRDIAKQLLAPTDGVELDQEQLDWLREGLVTSWNNREVRGRIVVLHHPPYVTEASKWDQGQTLAVRHQLRQVLNQVAARVGAPARGRPLVDLGLSGHAHCLEYIETADTGHGDAWMPWLICGGSGYSLRRQRPEGPILRESREVGERTLARSQLFVGRSGRGSRLRRAYSGLRVDVAAGRPLRLRLTPLVAEKLEGSWRHYDLETIEVGAVELGG
jgi:3',5'-cyclic AMP phosphodiesterase CpdA